MKKITCLLLALFSGTLCTAQNEKNYDLHLSTGTITLAPNYNRAKTLKPARADLFQNVYYRYVQFLELPSPEQKEKLAEAGLKILMYLPNNTFIAAIQKKTNLSSLPLPTIRSLHMINARHKMLRELQEAIDADNFPAYTVKGKRIGISITYYESIDHESVKTWLNKNGYTISEEDKAARSFVVWVKRSKITKFVARPFVASAELVDDEPVPDNTVGRTSIRSNVLHTDYSGGRKYNGAGVEIAIQDDGIIGPHIDYQGRVLNQFPTNNTGNHGDHCSGTIMGAGNKDPMMRGMAWGANLHVYSASGYQAFSQINTHYNTLGIRIISTSYSDGCNVGYTTRAQQLDIQNLAMPELLHVFSAGNDGTSNCNYGAGAGWGNVTGGHKHSKNSIAVANLDYLDTRNTSSSRGPAYDGRLKPEVSAVGTNVWSTVNPNSYIPQTGTSMSCPAAAGIFAQLYQAYKDLNANTNPPSALMKAVVMNTADDLGNPGPDFGYGYGRINALKAVNVIEQGAHFTGTVSNGATNTHTIVVPPGTRRIKVMTYWHDYQAAVGAGIALVNNLNTTITDPSATTYSPLVLNFAPNVTSLNQNAAPGVDNRNNHEQITITNPSAGNYVLNVVGASVPMGPQAYYVTWLIETDGYTMIYPIGREGFTPGIMETIRWDAYETAGNQTLEYTANNGSTWTTISSTIPGGQRHYNWVPPSSVLSGQCRMRISRGAYSAESDTNFSIIAPPANLNVAWVCPDSVKLVWDPVPGATAYDVFKLGTMYMDSIGTSVTNTCVVANIPLMQSHWFSVRSRGPLDAVSRRAVAVEKTPGLYACPQVAIDAACNKVLNPSGTIHDCHNLSKQSIVIDLHNPGINPISNVPVFYRINNGPIVSEMYPGTLASQTSVTFTFATKANLNGTGTYNIKAWAKYTNDPVFTNDTALGKLMVTSGAVKSLPLAEDFETFNLCLTTINCGLLCNLSNGFINENSIFFDQLDWRTDNGGPPTPGTGPQVDFTQGTATGKYLYLESSSPCNSVTAHLLSPCIDLSTEENPLLMFGYHMYGQNMGAMYLDVFVNGEWINSIWSMSGNQGDAWKIANVDISAWASDTVTFRWRGITGPNDLSDMAIDGIFIGNNLGQKELQVKKQFRVFPNPTTGEFNVQIPSTVTSDLEYMVTDISGRVILSGATEVKPGEPLATINLRSFAAGVYTLRLSFNGQIEYTRLYKI